MISWGNTVTITHDNSKGCTIRQGPYFLEALSLWQGHLTEYWLQGFDVYQIIQKASDTIGESSAYWTEGCVNKTWMHVSDTLGARSVSWRERCCFNTGTLLNLVPRKLGLLRSWSTLKWTLHEQRLIITISLKNIFRA